jgi:hypothetical protein
MKTARAVSGILIGAGLWEASAPFILGYPDTATALWNTLLIGVILFTLGLNALILDDIDAYWTLDWISLVLELAGWTVVGLGRPTTGHS